MTRNLLLAALFAFCISGCGTSTMAPTSEQTNYVASSQAVLQEVVIDGKIVKAWVVRDTVNGQYKVIMVLDYPCGAVGPLPQGHGRDCTDDPDGTPSDEPDARWAGDPTAED